MFRIDQHIQMGRMALLEHLHQFRLLGAILFGPDRLDIRRHRFCNQRVTQGSDRFQPFDVPVLLARHLREEPPAVTNLADRLLEGNGHPAILAAFTRPFEDFANAIRIVSSLHPGLTFRAD